MDVLLLEERVEQIEHVEPHSATVDLGKDVADPVDLQRAVELDVGYLVLLGDFLEMTAELAGHDGELSCLLARRRVARRREARLLLAPVAHIALRPGRQRPAAAPGRHLHRGLADDRHREDVAAILLVRRARDRRPGASLPLIVEGVVAVVEHEGIDANEEEGAARPARQRLGRRDERVI